jgi:hypothetical protein
MKKILITSTKFSGEISAIYADDLLLVSIDFSMAQLNAEQIDWMKGRIPSKLFAEFSDCFKGVPITALMEGYEVTFDMFWHAYGEKINRLRCEKRWDKLSKTDKAKAYAGVAVYLRHLAKNTWQSKANPDTYLMNKYWNNEWK